MKFKFVLLGLIGAFLILVFVVVKYQKYRYYSSEKFVEQLDDWWLHIDRYYKINGQVPSFDEFVEFAKTDSFVIENFPNLIPTRIDPRDFVLATDSSYYFSVWLFGDESPNDTLLFSNMNFAHFLSKRNVLVLKAPLSELNFEK
jgi:hypothetical protein